MRYSVTIKFSSDGRIDLSGDEIAMSIVAARARQDKQGVGEKAGGAFWNRRRQD